MKALCNDGVTQSACTSITASAPQDTIKPTYSSSSTNSTQAGKAVQFNLTMNDNVALHPSGKYIFGLDNCTGRFVNDSAVSFTSTPQKISIVKVVSSTVGCTIRWFVNFTDNAGNRNDDLVRSPFSFVTTVQPTPTTTTTTTTTQPSEPSGPSGEITNLPPSISLLYPLDKSSIKTPFYISFSVKDDTGINKTSLALEMRNDELGYKTGIKTIASNYYTGKCQLANEECKIFIPDVNLQIKNNYYLYIYANDTSTPPKQRNLTIVFNVVGYTITTTSTTTTTTLPSEEEETNYFFIVIAVLILLAILVAIYYFYISKVRPARTFEELYKKWGKKKIARG